jgi:hypothetical protein
VGESGYGTANGSERDKGAIYAIKRDRFGMRSDRNLI